MEKHKNCSIPQYYLATLLLTAVEIVGASQLSAWRCIVLKNEPGNHNNHGCCKSPGEFQGHTPFLHSSIQCSDLGYAWLILPQRSVYGNISYYSQITEMATRVKHMFLFCLPLGQLYERGASLEEVSRQKIYNVLNLFTVSEELWP